MSVPGGLCLGGLFLGGSLSWGSLSGGSLCWGGGGALRLGGLCPRVVDLCLGSLSRGSLSGVSVQGQGVSFRGSLSRGSLGDTPRGHTDTCEKSTLPTIPEIASFNFISQFVLWPLGVVGCAQYKPEFYSLVKLDL